MTKWDDPKANPLADLQAWAKSQKPIDLTAGEALKSLKVKMSAIGKAAQQVGLASGGIHVHGSMPDPNWDPLEHPKDHLGRFRKKLTGAFIFGKAKKAVFTQTIKGNPSQIDYDLQPGDKVYSVHMPKSGSTRMVVQDVNGQLHVHGSFDASGKVHEVSPSSLIVDQFKNGPKTLIKQAPYTEVPGATSVEEAKAQINKADGKVVYAIGKTNVVLEANQQMIKVNIGTSSQPALRFLVTTHGIADDLYLPDGSLLPDDKWDDKQWQKIANDPFSSSINSYAVVADGAGSASPHPDPVKTYSTTSLPSVFVFPNPTPGNPSSVTLMPGEKLWKLPGEGGDGGDVYMVQKSDGTSDLASGSLGAGFTPSGHEFVSDWKGTGYAAVEVMWQGKIKAKGELVAVGMGTKSPGSFKPAQAEWEQQLMAQPVEAQSVVYEGKTYTAPGPQSEGGFWYGPEVGDVIGAGFAKKLAEQQASGITSLTPYVQPKSPADSTPVFTHPLSGQSIDLGPYDSVYQHKLSPNSYIVYGGPQGASKFFDKNGTLKNASFDKHLQHLGKNYTLVYGPPQATPTEAPEPQEPETPKFGPSKTPLVLAVPTSKTKIGSATFTHPVSGATFNLDVEASLFQHKTSPNSFIIYSDQNPDGSGPYAAPVFFDKNGKQKNASPLKHLKFLATNYDKIYGPAQNLPDAQGEVHAPKAGTTPKVHAPKAHKAKAKAEKPALPTEWTAPDGSVITLNVGDSVFEHPSKDTVSDNSYMEVSVLVKADGSGLKWSGAGTKYGWGVESKAAYKKQGWTMVADNPLPKVDALNAQPEKSFANVYEAQTYADEAVKSLGSEWFGLSESYYSGWSTYGGVFDLSAPEMVKKFADPKFREFLEVKAATMAQAKSLTGESSVKTQVGKTRSRFESLAVIAKLAQLLQEPDSSLPEIQGLYALIGKKLNNPGQAFGNQFPLNATMLNTSLKMQMQSWMFKKSLTGLNFDPDTAPLETLTDYGSKHGFPLISQLSLEDARLWVKIDLGDPSVTKGYGSASKAELESKAKYALSSAKAVLYLKGLQEAEAKAEPKKDPAKVKAQQAIQKAVLDQSKKLYVNYVQATPMGTNMQTLTYQGPDAWKLHKGSGTDTSGDQILTTYDAMKLLATVPEGQSIGWKPTTTVQVNGEASYKDKLAAFQAGNGVLPGEGVFTDGSPGMPVSEQVKYLKGHGAQFVAQMTGEQRSRWIKADIGGDNLAKYAVELEAGNTGSTTAELELAGHPGSPYSPEGKAARQVLADFLVSQPWWQESTKDANAFDAPFPKQDVSAAWLAMRPEWYVDPLVPNPDQSAATRRDTLRRWLQDRMPLPAPSYDPELAANLPSSLAAPAGVADQAWAIVLATEKGDPETLKMVEGIDPTPFSPNTLGSGTVPPNVIAFIPDDLKRLALWAKNPDSGISSTQRSEVLGALRARINQGSFIPAGVPLWTSPQGKKWPLAPGSTVWKYGSGSTYLIIDPDQQGGITVGSNGSFSAIASYSVQNYIDQSKKVLAIPQTLTYEKAKADGLQATKVSWDAVEQAEAPKAKITLPGTNYPASVLLFSVKLDPKSPPTLKENASQLPLPVLKVAVWALSQGEQGTLNVIEHKLKSGHYSTLKNALILDPTKPYASKVMSGQTTVDDLSTWPFDQLKALGDDLGVPVPTGESKDVQALSTALIQAFSGELAVASPETTGLPAIEQLQLTKTGTKSGGVHSGFLWADQNGNAWMSKGFPSDDNGPSRVDQEDAANRIGRLFGFHQPETGVKTLDGQYSYIQHVKPALSDEGLLGMSPADLSDEQLAQAMEEHVLDRVIANTDTHQRNLLLDPNGHDVIGIDKGVAFKFFPDDKLAVGQVMPGQGEPVWYDQFYQGVRDGSISKDRADKVTKRVLRKAWQIQERDDAEYLALLEQGLAKRKTWPGAYPTHKQYIDALVERKHGLFNEFVDFYQKQVYGKSAYSFDIDPEQIKIAKLGPHTHVAVSDEYAEDVLKSGSHGQSLMIGGPELEDVHMVTFMEEMPGSGAKLLRGQAKVRKDADFVLTKWLKAQTVTDNTGSYGGMSSLDAVDITSPSDVLPMVDTWYAVIESAAKTVNHHSPKTGGDGQYNQTNITNMGYKLDEINFELKSLNEWEEAHPDEPYKSHSGTMVTKEQQTAWKAAMEQLVKDIEFVTTAKNDGVKVEPHISKPTYTPTPGLDDSVFDPSKSPASADAPTWVYIPDKGPQTVYTQVLTKTGKPKGWVTTDASGKQTELSLNELDMLIGSDNTHYHFNDPNVEGPAEGHVKIGLKDVKVVRVASHGTGGKYDPEKGILIHKNDTTTGFTGYQYDIEFGDTQISYRPWNEQGVAKAQQGELTFKVKDWDGNPDRINDIIDVLREMGLSLPEANEQNMEHFYWKHLYEILQNRNDRNNVKWSKVRVAYEEAKKQAGGKWSMEEETAALKKAWAQAIGQDAVDNADFMPHFSRFRPQTATEGITQGHPYWLRPDVSLQQLHDIYFGPNGVSNRTSGASTGSVSKRRTEMGWSGYLPTEERLRVVALYATGGYDSQSSDQENGATAFTFTRQYQDAAGGSQVFFHPRVMLRTNNYSFGHDTYGEIDTRSSSAPFEMSGIADHKGGGGNETQVKYGLSYLDDVFTVIMPDATSRQELINKYHALGIFQISGMPIEEVIVTTEQQAQLAIIKGWKIALAEEQKNKGMAKVGLV